ncbi:MAG: hypothetical protein AABY33_03135 [Pseudomonadota bacterium]
MNNSIAFLSFRPTLFERIGVDLMQKPLTELVALDPASSAG